jgi:putative FmdB family regulatory protein
MPIFEYVCEECQHKFELLVMNGSTVATCAKCKSEKVRKLFSVFASTSGTPDMGQHMSRPITDGGSCGSCGSTERRCD